MLTDGDACYEGQCVWAWKKATEGPLPEVRTYPITLFAQSIHQIKDDRAIKVPKPEQVRLAHDVKRLLERSNPEGTIEVAE